MCFLYIVFLSGLAESSGSSAWELFSIINNKQRGSQERMIEKLHYTVEHKQQSISKANERVRVLEETVKVIEREAAKMERERERESEGSGEREKCNEGGISASSCEG